VYYDRNDFQEFYPYQTPNPSYEETQVGEWWGVEAQATRHFWDRLILTLGGEYRDDFRQEYSIVNATNGVASTQVHTNRQNYGIYLEGDFAVVTNLHLNAGFRYDQYGDFDPAFSPRVAAIYNPFGQSVFKAIYGEAFRAPNLFELRHIPGAPVPNPETINTYELVYEQGIGDHLRSSVDGFYNQIHDLITFENGFYQNISEVETKGVELALEGFWPSGLRGRASYTFQNTHDEQSGTLVFDSPHNLAKLNVSVPLLRDRIFGGVEVQYVSKRTSSHLGSAVAGEDAGDYAVVNLTMFSHKLVKGLEFSGSVYNLLDRHYSDPSPQVPGRPTQQDIIEQDGRTFRLKLTYRF
jgi:iron complex outermembrane receptor protein